MIGYVFLGLVFATLLFLLPLLAQRGLSPEEIDSATSSYYLNKADLIGEGLVDLPYHLIQKLSLVVFGLTPYAIKLPSIIIGLLLGLLLVLLLNRWFKSNVSLLSSCLIILSTPFLFLAGSGTPLIMLVFWPTLLLWLGSKIYGEKRPKSSYCFLFVLMLLLSIFTPYMIYFAIFCIIFVLIQPHLRFILKNLPRIQLVVIGLVLVAGFILLGIGIVHNQMVAKELLLSANFHMSDFLSNISRSFVPVFSWYGSVGEIFLSPLISLPTFILALIGLFSTTKGFFASRNSIASLLIVFCIIIAGFNPNTIISLILPFSILIAHGIKYLLEKWYGLFPENPYARISALMPLTVLFAIMIISGLSQYIYGYRYNPNIVDNFSYKLQVIGENLENEKLLVFENYDFYKILENTTELTIISSLEDSVDKVAILGKPVDLPEEYELSRIFTSPMRDNSDIIYLYIVKEGE